MVLKVANLMATFFFAGTGSLLHTYSITLKKHVESFTLS